MTTTNEARPVATVTAQEIPPVPVSGILDINGNHAFVRADGYLPGPGDTHLSSAQVDKYGLRPGDRIEGAARSPRRGDRREQFRNLVRLDTVNGRAADNPEN